MLDAPEGAPDLAIAVLGCGTVGTQVVRLLTEHADDLGRRIGRGVRISGVLVSDLDKPRDPAVPTALLTTDASALIEGADVVVELLGGTTTARDLVLAALTSGASVVTANKALLATSGPELYAAADTAGVDLLFEAAVAGAVPVVRGVRESLAGDRVQRVLGIVNGTTNFILDEMTTGGLDFDVALTQAQDLGYAEADPTADVDGHDAAAKAAILASLAFHTRVALADVACEGIREITAADIAAARESGGVIKLLAVAERVPATADRGEAVAVRVNPVILPTAHPLAGVGGAYNAVVVEAEAAGRLMFYGAGAGGAPTASAVLGDIVSAARHRTHGGRAPAESASAALPLAGPADVVARLQIRLLVDDRPGVLAQVATVVAEHGVSIESVRQQVSDEGAAVLAVVTHEADEASLAATVEALRTADGVRRVLSAHRVERA
ncbi:homoserine dehydrogenase [Serinibacter arcticus]|uniref:Homoserine dehydrogenase n=1 Tax=Serinibacter arcticus TaxID=1655435 RepID=A0A2U1ZYU8_9MICO|nr:homoserine dehydrogenase [Serinibacter arcticus]PWD52165.1 homoserine dehydrogenase [Serinibacter arcticus]